MDSSFRFSKEILFRLGEELNPNPDQSILELVKNSYDADALNCTVELLDTSSPGGTIRVTDDGDGMDDALIADGWLVLGRSTKSRSRSTRLKRIPAGTKGLGRLAALRMGERATLTSRPRSAPGRQFTLCIDWRQFEHADVVEEVTLTINDSVVDSLLAPGTEIVVEKLDRKIGRIETKQLARSLLLLADPFAEDPQSFKPILKTADFDDLGKLVEQRYFADAEFHLVAEVDANGAGRAHVADWKGKKLFSASHTDLTRDKSDRVYQCPPVHFDLWVFLLDAQTFSTRTATLGEVRQWLQAFGGVHLYHNSLRVSPYGNPGNDWLDMNLRRAQSPEVRPSTNTSIGRIRVSDTAEHLVQKTDRSGFIETEPFLELKRFASDSMEWMARRRLEQVESLRSKRRSIAPKGTDRARETVEKALAKVPKESRAEVERALDRYDTARQLEVSTLQKEVQLYRTLSTAGITAATFAHESSGNPVKIISQSVKSAQKRAKTELGKRYPETLERPLNLIETSAAALRVLSNVTLSLLDHEKRRASRVQIHDVIRDVLSLFAPFLLSRSVTVDTQLMESSPFLLGSRAAMESILTNLLDNSLIWFEGRQERQRRIVIRTSISGESLCLRFLDNGPGIEGIRVADIWLPGQTTRPNGTGLGLTIVRDAVSDLGGKVSALDHGELGGAEFIVELPLIRRGG